MNLGLAVQPTSIADLLRALDHRLTPIDNFQCKVIGPITTPVTGDTAFTVDHNLGRAPVAYIWNVDKTCTIYDSTRASWTDKQMTLKCSTASAVLYLIVF